MEELKLGGEKKFSLIRNIAYTSDGLVERLFIVGLEEKSK
jgi:hypothetical protein